MSGSTVHAVSEAPQTLKLKPLSDQFPTDFSWIMDKRWQDRRQFMQTMGYRLRLRRVPPWVKSRVGGIQPESTTDDFLSMLSRNLIEATRIHDCKSVVIKRVTTGDKGSRIALMLSSNGVRYDPRNHSVPILDTFQDDDDPSVSYIVMPFLKHYNHLPFEHKNEVVDLVNQLLEGLVFLHEQGVAHRDCAGKNIMMDATRLYTHSGLSLTNSFSTSITMDSTEALSRSCAGVTYYYIDFGASSYFHPSRSTSPSRPRLVLGTGGRDDEAPELSATVPYDPFKVDIFTLGNLFRRQFYDVYTNVEFLAPLITAMTHSDPTKRLTAVQAWQIWEAERQGTSDFFSRWPLRHRATPFLDRVLLDALTLYETLRIWILAFYLWVFEW